MKLIMHVMSQLQKSSCDYFSSSSTHTEEGVVCITMHVAITMLGTMVAKHGLHKLSTYLLVDPPKSHLATSQCVLSFLGVQQDASELHFRRVNLDSSNLNGQISLEVRLC